MSIRRATLFAIPAGWLVPALAIAQPGSYEWGPGMHPMWGMGGAWGIGMMLMMFLFWILVIAGLVLGIRWLLDQGKGRRSDSALELLRQRYAKGEINKEEFETRRKDLS